MLLLYAAINLFMEDRWSLGSLAFSLAVSVKMNVLLYSPALLLAYLTILGLPHTFVQLSICAGVQVYSIIYPSSSILPIFHPPPPSPPPHYRWC